MGTIPAQRLSPPRRGAAAALATPVRRARSVTVARAPSSFPVFASVEEAVLGLRPTDPLHCLHPNILAHNASAFLRGFPGSSFYAIKANPDVYVLEQLHAAGIRHFDVASLGEVQLIHSLFPDAEMAFMHPVKSPEAIRAAWRDYGVKTFVLDSAVELVKILEATNHAPDLTLVVRLARPKGTAACSLAGKFGASPAAVVELLREADRFAARTGLSFHVGSQTLDPVSYREAIALAAEVIRESGVGVGVFDLGGGFPIEGLGMPVPPLADFFAAISESLATAGLPEGCEIWSEPGRALSGDATTLVVRVELRKEDTLYINDGSFGNLFEVCSMNWRNDARLIRDGRPADSAGSALQPFRFFGPTCDSVDYMQGPFLLPGDVREGDWIALAGMGAYGQASQSRFNGFYSDCKAEIRAATPKLVRLRGQASKA